MAVKASTPLAVARGVGFPVQEDDQARVVGQSHVQRGERRGKWPSVLVLEFGQQGLARRAMQLLGDRPERTLDGVTKKHILYVHARPGLTGRIVGSDGPAE